MFDHLLASFGGQTALFRDDLAKDNVNLASHASRVTADVEAGLLLQEVGDQGSIFTKLMLDVHLLLGLPREGRDDIQGIPELFSESLKGC